MPNTSRMSWPYPSEDQDPWYVVFQNLLIAMDSSGYAAREDRHLILAGGGTLTWDAASSLLTWSGSIQVSSPITGFLPYISAGSVGVDEGEVLYATLTRAPSNNVSMTITAAAQVPSDDSSYVLAVRIGTSLYWRNGAVFTTGGTYTGLGAIASGGVKAIVAYDWASNYSYTQAVVPVEETMGYGKLDGSDIGATAYFQALFNPQFGAAGTASIRLYDLGPSAGPPAVPTLIATLSTTSSGIQYKEQALTVGASPGANQIANTSRMYEVAVYQSSLVGDTVYVGSSGIIDR